MFLLTPLGSVGAQHFYSPSSINLVMICLTVQFCFSFNAQASMLDLGWPASFTAKWLG